MNTMKKIFAIAFLMELSGMVLLPSLVSAQCGNAAPDCDTYCTTPCDPTTGVGLDQPANSYCICPATKYKTFEKLLEHLIDYLFRFATIITPVVTIIAGFMFMTSGGDVNKVNTAKRVIFYTVAGYAVILFAKGIIYLFKDILGG